MVTESFTRTREQLAKHYYEIVSKPFDDYVAIVGHGKTSAEFLCDIAHEVANELLIRKKNLQIQEDGRKASSNMRITKEDLINDWFVSLFDKRMAEARIGLRDQKRIRIQQGHYSSCANGLSLIFRATGTAGAADVNP